MFDLFRCFLSGGGGISSTSSMSHKQWNLTVPQFFGSLMWGQP